MLMSIKAADLQVGDIVRIKAGVAGRVNKILDTTYKTITYHFTYTQCDAYPSLVGKSRSNRHLLRTELEVDRLT